ncbi:short-chain dehydrogenase [Arachidicoccus ginsenosidimutans]|uniref:SDR family NAD(P)-dependent oxidoreductase n=1 Tax=Arachidicoccus sp. BS20 TaxID=1850526 RepID=UPI0007F0F7A1|nr:SDR family NAD(P)-dependent oxidoreductase [Arachidicoccus sp. BS20]ANI90732.1 short-chain dehydrogenase [Arachidicoccus sp. BS20]
MESQKAYIITGPTSGIGYETALELAKHGTVILVGRNRDKLNQVQKTIEQNGRKAISVVCDISDITSVKHTAQQIISLNLPIAGLLNNAGIMSQKATKSAQGFDMVFATNYLGAFAFTEALVPHLPIGANVVFIGSAIEDPERKPAKMMGMKGGRYISAEASARGEWKEGGAKMAGIDAYATSKQCVLAAAMFLSKENPRLNFNVVEPGIMGGSTNLGSDANINPFVRFLMSNIMKLMMLLPAFFRFKSTPQKAAKIITEVLTDTSGKTGIYFDEKGMPMQGSELAHDAKFQERVATETRALLARI